VDLENTDNGVISQTYRINKFRGQIPWLLKKLKIIQLITRMLKEVQINLEFPIIIGLTIPGRIKIFHQLEPHTKILNILL
jgi:hypothetical protein